jgi:tetratricopeptide (TPR) repeat protein
MESPNDRKAQEGLVALGRSYLKAGLAAEALAAFRYTRLAHGDSRVLDRWLGAAAQQCEEDEEAIAAYERALGSDANDIEVTVNLAELYLNQLAIEKAATLLKRALELDPKIQHPAGVRARVLIMKTKKQIK